MAGLVTRIGQWIDTKWEEKATVGDLRDQETRCSDRHIGALGALAETRKIIDGEIESVKLDSVVTPKEFAELKERLGHLEVYVGMKRVVDPSKPAVAKSAFAM